ncbi:MAG: hypothetical protein K0U78_02480 [Actinomycetia bacterium]|nr:hypothetical protein [Actinomycetes bacterium]
MSAHEQPSPSAVGDEVQDWVEGARAVLTARRLLEAAAAAGSTTLRNRTVQARRNNRVLWHFLPMFPDDAEFIRKIANRACLPPVSTDEQRELDRLTNEVVATTIDANLRDHYRDGYGIESVVVSLP